MNIATELKQKMDNDEVSVVDVATALGEFLEEHHKPLTPKEGLSLCLACYTDAEKLLEVFTDMWQKDFDRGNNPLSFTNQDLWDCFGDLTGKIYVANTEVNFLKDTRNGTDFQVFYKIEELLLSNIEKISTSEDIMNLKKSSAYTRELKEMARKILDAEKDLAA